MMWASENKWQRAYRRYPAVWYFLFFALGIYLGWEFRFSVQPTATLVAVVFLFVLMLLAHRFFSKLFPLIVIPLVVLFGLAHMYAALNFFPPAHIALVKTGALTKFSGIVVQARYRPDGRDRYLLALRSGEREGRSQPLAGKIQLVRGKNGRRLQLGDLVEVIGQPERLPLPANPGMFNYRRFMNLRGVFGGFYYTDQNLQIASRQEGDFWQQRIIWPAGEYLRRQIERYFRGDTRAVLKALLIGQRSELQKSVTEAFKRSGIIHVLAISGLHVGFLLLMFLLLFGLLRLPYPWQVGLALICLFLFVVVVDFKPPVVRAFLMAVLFYWNKFSERRASALNILAVAGLLILVIQPQQLLWPDFQFSFAAVAGILYGFPRLNEMLPRFRRWARLNKWLRDPFLASASAIAATIPLTWYYYGALQVGALFINIVAIPLIGLLVVSGFLFVLFAVTQLPILTGMAGLIDRYYLLIQKIIQEYAAFGWVQLELPFPSPLQLALLLVLLILIFNLGRSRRFGLTGAVAFLFLFALLIHPISGNMRLIFADVGQGDAAIVQFPNGKVLMIDGGEKRPGLDAAKRFLLPVLRYYGINHVDYLLGTHGHSDHIGGFLTILQKIKVDTLLLSPYRMNTKIYRSLLETAAEQSIPIRWLERGQQVRIDPDTRVYVLHPFGPFEQPHDFHGAEVNNSSVVVKIVYGRRSFLFTGDLEQSAEPAVERFGRFLQADILKVGHHGSVTSSSPSFLKLVRPEYAIVSVGRRNRYFHPSKITMRRLRRFHSHPFRTDHFGALVFECDGNRLRFVHWRE